MGLFDAYSSVHDSWPIRAIEAIVVDSARPVWKRVVGASLTEDEVRTRQREIPITTAEIGAVAVRQGLEHDDGELVDIGKAMVAKALADTDGQAVQAVVTEIAAALPVSDVTDSPFVAPEVAEKAASALEL
jgi:hypothetical protein